MLHYIKRKHEAAGMKGDESYRLQQMMLYGSFVHFLFG